MSKFISPNLNDYRSGQMTVKICGFPYICDCPEGEILYPPIDNAWKTTKFKMSYLMTYLMKALYSWNWQLQINNINFWLLGVMLKITNEIHLYIGGY